MSNRFVQQHMQAALNIEAETGVPAALILAQASLESGNGLHAPGNNFFGIKGNGPGGTQNLMTTEVYRGKPVRVYQQFRKYNTVEESFRDHARLISTSPYYRGVMAAAKNGTIQDVARAIGRSPYATDPKYGEKIWDTMKKSGIDKMQPAKSKQVLTPEPKKNKVAEPTPLTAHPERLKQIPGLIKNVLSVPKVQASEPLPYQKINLPKAENQEIQANRPASMPINFLSLLSKPQTPQGINFPLPSQAGKAGMAQAYSKPAPVQTSSKPNQSYNHPRVTTVTVKPGDTLSQIAQQVLGNANRWREIQGFSGDPRKLPVGTKLTIRR